MKDFIVTNDKFNITDIKCNKNKLLTYRICE